VNREFDEMGARYNAFTSEENTVYYGNVLPKFQNRLLDLLADMMRPALRDEDFDMEKECHPRRDRHVSGQAAVSRSLTWRAKPISTIIRWALRFWVQPTAFAT
jgi:hypothetical protein